MKHQVLSEKYGKWIVEYTSDKCKKPIFFVWLTDTSDNNQDKLIVNKKGKIVATKSIGKTLKVVQKLSSLPDAKSTQKWIKKSRALDHLSSNVVSIKKLEKKIESSELTALEIEQLVDFLSLFGDYETQMGVKEDKLVSQKGTLAALGEYYYNQIFWPSLNEEKKHKPAKFKINPKKLAADFKNARKSFEKCLVIK